VHFENLTIEGGFRRGETAAMINGAEGIEPVAGPAWHYTVGLARFRCTEEAFEKMYGQGGHVAGYDQVPVSFGDAEGGKETAKRAAVVNAIRDNGIAEFCITVRRADDGDVSGGGADASGDVVEQCGIAHRKQGFVAAHAGAAASGQDVTRLRTTGCHPEGRAHEMMIPYVRRAQDHIAVGNNLVYICSLLTIVMLAASPTMAAEIGPASVKTDAKTLVVRADPRTGRLVRVSTQHAGSSRPAPKNISDLVEQSAKAHDVDPLLVHSMIQVESDYNPHAVSPKGAEGLMQLTPSTARMLGVSNSFDPEQNIEAGVKYLKYLQSVYKDDRLALAAYNAGPGAVSKYKQVPPYPETQNYVAQVGKRYDDARKASAGKQAAVEHPPVIEEQHPKIEQFVDENGRLHLRTAQ